MKEMVYSGDIFLLPRANANDAVCITTNGIVRRDGKAVMGAGIAKYARDNFERVDSILGKKLSALGNQVHYIGIFKKPGSLDRFTMLSFPTKEDWRENSKPKLIERSCREVMVVASQHKLDMVYLPCPGCANGHLDYWKDVRPILLEELDDRFTVVVPEHIFAKGL